MIIASGADHKELSTLTRLETMDGKEMLIASSKTDGGYFSPRQLVQSALAGCLSMTIRRDLDQCGIRYRDAKVYVDMVDTSENGMTHFEVDIVIDSDEDKEKIEALKKEAVEKCYIHRMLTHEIKVTKNDSLHKVEEEFIPPSDRCCM